MKTTLSIITVACLLLGCARNTAKSIALLLMTDAIEKHDSTGITNLMRNAQYSEEEQDILVKKAHKEAEIYDCQANLSFEAKKFGILLSAWAAGTCAVACFLKSQENQSFKLLASSVLATIYTATVLLAKPYYFFHQPQAILDYLKETLPAYAHPTPERQALKESLIGAARPEDELD